MKSKVCAECDKRKLIKYFAANKGRRSGVQPYCRKCQKARMKSHYERNKDAYKARAYAAKKAVRDLIRSEKNRPCMDCGNVFHFSAMDFDHRAPKEKRFSIGAWGRPQSAIHKVRAEIAKCDVVCANCHRIRTYKSRNGPIV